MASVLKWLLCKLIGHAWVSKNTLSDDGITVLYEYRLAPFCKRCGKVAPWVPNAPKSEARS